MIKNTMDETNTMDFKALRAKFQDEELLLKQPRIKPALPEKPKVVPPPQSPPHYLPAGARPSLLTSISQTLEGKTSVAPRVVFKEEKKESKKPLLQTNSKGKDKSEGKLKKGKDKTAKGSKEKPGEEASDQKQKKENGKDKKLPLLLPVASQESTTELVSAAPPPKAAPTKKKGFLGFKSSKRWSYDVPADPILDATSSDIPGPAPLIPVPSGSDVAAVEPEVSAPKALLPDVPASADSTAAEESTPPVTIPASPDFNPPPAFIPDIPAPEVPTPESETLLEIETPALPVSTPATATDIIPSQPSAASTPPPPIAASTPPPPPIAASTPPPPSSASVPPPLITASTPPPPLAASTPPASSASTPPPSAATPDSPPVASTPSPSPPEPELTAEAALTAGVTAAVEEPPLPVTDQTSVPPSPKAERPISALSALERAEDMSPGKKITCDQRIFNALEKARKKTSSPQTNPTTSSPVTPPPEELPPQQSPALPLPELPPIDYDHRAGNAPPETPEEVDSSDQGQASAELEAVTEERPEPIPELLVLPPPPPRKVLPDPESLGPAPEKPERPPSVDLSGFVPLPPPVEENEIPAPPEFSGTDTTDLPEFDDVASDAHSPVSEWGNGELAGPDSATECYSNGITTPGPEVLAAPALVDQENALPESSLPVSQETPPPAGPQAEVNNGVYESTENVYEDINVSAKKKGKTDGGKKRKDPPKNPYAEAPQKTNEEKSKTGRFGKGDKKAAAEGPDEKELKKKEKQRLEKEKKELKEKQEREKKEQKEREKRENEMKKKFKITGQEEAMYEAKVTVTTKGRKNDLPLKDGDDISIIRTTNCPKGKWLARDRSSNYGYVAVDHVQLDIKEMLELGKKAAITRKSSSNVVEPEVTSTGSRASNHYPLSAESFTDDSEEWTGDEEEPLSPAAEPAAPLTPLNHTRTLSMPDMGDKDVSINHQHSQSDISPDGSHIQARHEALQKLATFFHSPKPAEQAASSTEPETSPVPANEEVVQLPEATSTQEMDFDQNDMFILPPPDLYADLVVE